MGTLSSSNSSDSDESVKRGMTELQLTMRQVIKLKKHQREIVLKLNELRVDLTNANNYHGKLEGRVKHTENVSIDLTTAFKKLNRDVQQFGDMFYPL